MNARIVSWACTALVALALAACSPADPAPQPPTTPGSSRTLDTSGPSTPAPSTPASEVTHDDGVVRDRQAPSDVPEVPVEAQVGYVRQAAEAEGLVCEPLNSQGELRCAIPTDPGVRTYSSLSFGGLGQTGQLTWFDVYAGSSYQEQSETKHDLSVSGGQHVMDAFLAMMWAIFPEDAELIDELNSSEPVPGTWGSYTGSGVADFSFALGGYSRAYQPWVPNNSFPLNTQGFRQAIDQIVFTACEPSSRTRCAVGEGAMIGWEHNGADVTVL